MAELSLREAAQQAGTSKSTILRAVKAGRLSATRDDDGGYRIDPAELHRVYPWSAPRRAS
jgi:excisionase family DNA binding protein